MKTESCKIIDIKECDILYQVKYNRKCQYCEYEDNKEHLFTNVMKCGITSDIDNWQCPKCGKLNVTKINVKD